VESATNKAGLVFDIKNSESVGTVGLKLKSYNSAYFKQLKFYAM
jgi:hypothetical protein